MIGRRMVLLAAVGLAIHCTGETREVAGDPQELRVVDRRPPAAPPPADATARTATPEAPAPPAPAPVTTPAPAPVAARGGTEPPPMSPRVPSACAALHPPALPPLGNRSRDPLHGAADLRSATALAAGGDHAAALRAYLSAIRADPYLGLAYLGAAEAHLYTDDDPDAIAELAGRAVELLPDNPRAHLRYGDHLAERGQKADAVAEWRCALALRGDLLEARKHLARMLIDAGDAPRATEEMQIAVVNHPSDVQVHVLLADALEATRHLREAADEVLAAAKLAARSAALYRRAAGLYAASGDPRQARQARQLADRLDPPPKARTLRQLPRRQ